MADPNMDSQVPAGEVRPSMPEIGQAALHTVQALCNAVQQHPDGLLLVLLCLLVARGPGFIPAFRGQFPGGCHEVPLEQLLCKGDLCSTPTHQQLWDGYQIMDGYRSCLRTCPKTLSNDRGQMQLTDQYCIFTHIIAPTCL